MKPRPRLVLACLCASILLFSVSAQASLLGSQVTGLLNVAGWNGNAFDPNNGGFFGPPPPGYLNSAGTTVTIAEPAIEFGFGSAPMIMSANFSATSLTIFQPMGIFPDGRNDAFHIVFTDLAFSAFSSVSLDGSTFPGLIFSLSGDTLTIDQSVFDLLLPRSATFTFSVPDGGASALLLGLGLVGLCAAGRAFGWAPEHPRQRF